MAVDFDLYPLSLERATISLWPRAQSTQCHAPFSKKTSK